MGNKIRVEEVEGSPESRNPSQQKICYLGLYEEVLGDLCDLTTIDNATIAQIGNIPVILPLDMEPRLKPLLGSRIAILRTDVPGKEYLFRSLSLRDHENRVFADDCTYRVRCLD